jgi:hypothetical protein
VTELNDEERFFEPLSSALQNPQITQKAATMNAEKRRSAGQLVFVAPLLFATGRDHRSRLQRCAKSAEDSRVTKGVATLETNFVLLVVFCSAL